MLRLSELDVPARLSSTMPTWVAEVLTGVLVLVASMLVRVVLDAILPGIAPFSLLFPFGLIAALLAGWRAGALAFYAGQLYAWYYVFPPAGFGIADVTQAANLIFVALSGALILFVAQIFRDSARQAAVERAAKLAERDLLLSELNHRMKNNFQMVAGLLELQRNRASSDEVKAALGDALGRVMGIANAHSNLYAPGEDMTSIDAGAYLGDLCANLAKALFADRRIVLDCRCEPAPMERDRAVALGLIVNELVTNAAKHAFEDDGDGRITVEFGPSGDGWRLAVSDDGRGLPTDFAATRKGLGRGLVDGFAKQAGGAMTIADGPGSTFVLEMAK